MKNPIPKTYKKTPQLFSTRRNKQKVLFKILKHAFVVLTLTSSYFSSLAQCPAGTERAVLDWDYKDFLVYSGNYTNGNGYLANNTWARTQHFTFGTQRLTIEHAYPDNRSYGDNTTHTAEAGTYGTGADIQFGGNGQITLTFESEVQNLQFTVHDIDRRQQIQLDARNDLNVSQNVTMSTFTGTILSLTNNGTATAMASSSNTASATNALTGSVNLDIAGPVKSVIINITTSGTNDDLNFWISDISACSAGSFPNSYYEVSKPFTGQPGYVLHAYDKSVYAVDPVTGQNKLLFTDPYMFGAPSGSNKWTINSMGYDPYNRVLYYVYSLTNYETTNTVLKKYDFNTETISTVLADIRTIGIPLTTYAGIESGAAAFYDGSLYLGIETSNNSRNSGRESVIWKIDFDASNVPYRASQAFALPVDNPSTNRLIHDWADFAISNGILYNFDGANGGGTELDVYEYNLLTGATINFTSPTYIPGQNAVDWKEDVFQIWALNPTPAYIAPYNKGLGTIGTQVSIPPSSGTIPSLGDAGEAFRPLMDFGDAPSSFDPAGVDPAVHERTDNLRLGNNIDIEWLGTSSAMADADGADEDAIATPLPDLYMGTLNYTVNVNVFNNTGADATLIGWLDYNHNGTFEALEAVQVTVPSSAVTQNVPITWTAITVPATANNNTFLRIRLAPASDGMTTANMNGYIANGEVEDYPVTMAIILPTDALNLQAQKNKNSKVDLVWDFESSESVNDFTVQKSVDGIRWTNIGMVEVNRNGRGNYKFSDSANLQKIQYYRLKINFANTRISYSPNLAVSENQSLSDIKLVPNPAKNSTTVMVTSESNSEAQLFIHDYSGKTIRQKRLQLIKGINQILVTDLDQFNKGIYILKIKTPLKTETTKLMITK